MYNYKKTLYCKKYVLNNVHLSSSAVAEMDATGTGTRTVLLLLTEPMLGRCVPIYAHHLY
jgi:hypothetical protein